MLAGNSGAAQAPVWAARGPAPSTRGQVEGITDREVAGAVNAVATHPSDPNTVYIGAVNGGVWKSSNAIAASPTWVRQTDDQRSLSIGALEFDPTDPTHGTLAAGLGRFSSLSRRGGSRAGLLRTTNGGASWAAVDGGGTLTGLNVSGVAPRGAIIVLAANTADSPANAGVWRSADGGATWVKVSGGTGTGLPAGAAAGLSGDPAAPARLFTNAGPNGLYRSTNTGATWAKVSDAAMDAQIAAAGNVKVAVGPSGAVYMAVVVSGQLAEVFRSGDGGDTWAALGVPLTSDGVGAHPGGQGGIHLSLAADPGDANTVYVGGDRQDGPFPNPIGANDYTGRLFRGNAAAPAAGRWIHLTHSKTLGAAGGGTANTSAPHADSRGMRVAANGTLVEVDDGGVYRRTNPRSADGDWRSMNGNLQVTEFHTVAWDSVAKLVIGGAQDTGTPQQAATANARWESIHTGDGGVVAVDTSVPGQSTRYSSFQELSGFRRRVYDAANVLQSQVFPDLTVLDGGEPLRPQFYTPLRLNAVAPARLIVGADNSVYESLDQGDTLSEIGPGIRVNGSGPNPIAYGAAGNPDVLYVGSGPRVFVRTAAGGALSLSSAYPGGTVFGLALDPADPQTAFAADATGVYRTADAGTGWTTVTGNLPTLTPGTLRTVAFVATTPPSVAVGTDAGVFLAQGPGWNVWARFGTGLPRAPVYQLEHAAAAQLLLAGTFGRGAWTVSLGATTPAAVAAADGGPAAAPAAARPKKGVPMDGGTFTLRPGVVVDRDRRHLYLMSPAGGVEAVAVATGQVAWSSKVVAKPLGVTGGQVLAQAEAEPGANRLTVVTLDRTTGRPGAEGAVELPTGVRPTIQGTSRGDFVAAVRIEDGGATISWQYFDRPKRGLPPDTPDTLPANPAALPPAGVGGGGPNAKRGTFRFNVTTGATTPAPGVAVALPRGLRSVTVPAAARVPQAEGPQYLSADERHVLASRKTGTDRDWQKYTLTVYDRATGQRVGEFRSHVATVPFFVTDGQVVFETGAYTRRTAAGLTEEPPKVRAVSLTTGQEVWAKEVVETAYRGPLPP